MMNEAQQRKLDIQYMKRALRLAKKGQGMVSPNPLVGAVLVQNNHVISEGYHQKYGESHAEVNAINSASQSLKDATLYVTLEPCCHTDKQTPPCVNRIIKAGLRKVVIASRDPNPQVNGKSIQLLRDSGVEVKEDILDQENQELNKFYFKYVKTRLPYVNIKIAQTVDGYISNIENQQLWLTGNKSKRLVHKWRSIYDAVCIGANTLRVDDPMLTVRVGKKRKPVSIVITGMGNVEIDSRLFNQIPQNKTWLITAQKNHKKLLKMMEKTGFEIIGLPADHNQQITLSSVLDYLGKRKITSLLVEGGQKIFSQFVTSGLWDELNLLIAPKILGKGVQSFRFNILDMMPTLQLHQTKKVGEDVLLTYFPFISNPPK